MPLDKKITLNKKKSKRLKTIRSVSLYLTRLEKNKKETKLFSKRNIIFSKNNFSLIQSLYWKNRWEEFKKECTAKKFEKIRKNIFEKEFLKELKVKDKNYSLKKFLKNYDAQSFNKVVKRKNIAKIFRKSFATKAIVFVSIVAIIGTIYFQSSPRVQSATYTWNQTTWVGGADGGTYPNHTSNRTNWTKYSSKDAGVTAGTELELTPATGSATQTSDTDFGAGTKSNSIVNGSGNSGSVILAYEDTFDTTGGTDHSGADWTPGNGTSITGVHYNIGTFTVDTGTTVNVTQGAALRISATTVNILGTLNANSAGELAGSYDPGMVQLYNGQGSGGGTSVLRANDYASAGGAGYGGSGGNGGVQGGIGAGGSTYGSSTNPLEMGSGGGAGVVTNGSGSSNTGSGGAGGGAVRIKAVGTMTLSGTINANGGNGSSAQLLSTGLYAQGGGGSGGGVFLSAATLAGGGAINAKGGNGAIHDQWYGGGGGGGGRIYLATGSSSYSGSTSVTGGTGANAGSSGTSQTGTLNFISSGTFTSSVVDTGQKSSFSTLAYNKTTPADTSLTIDARAGNTITPDGTWTSWSTDISSGGDISALNGNRYVQYRVNLATTAPSSTPSLDDITINYKYYTSAPTATTSNADFNTEGEYTQEDATNGTDWGTGKATLHDVGDPYTKLLLHNNDTGLTDATGKTVTKGGDVLRTSDQSKFGGYSAYFDGSGDYLGLSGSSDFDFGSGDFTVDFWVNMPNTSYNAVFSTKNVYVAGYNGTFQLNVSPGTSNIYTYICNGTSCDFIQAGSTTLNADTWYHIAMVRSGNNIYLFKNGTQVGSGSTTKTISDGANGIYVGNTTAASPTSYQGYLDEFRISKGVARWTSNFTPPSSAYTLTSSYPTSQAYYLTTNNTSQISTLGYDHITGASITQTTPTNTSLKYFVSFDGRTTWKYWDGDSWETSTLDDLQTNGMAKATIEGLSQSNWEASGGFVSGRGSLDFAADLKTTDSTATPELDNIAINYIPIARTATANVNYTTEGDYTQENSSYSDFSNGKTSLSSSYDSSVKLMMHMDDASLTDSSPSARSITNNSVSRSSTQSKFGGYSAAFTNNNDYLRASSSSDFNFGTGDFTVDGWVYWSDNTVSTGIVTAAPQSITSGWRMNRGTNTGGDLCFLFFDSSSGGIKSACSGGGVVTSGQWYHVAAVRNGNSLKVYLNGNAVGTLDVTGLTITNSSNDLYLGQIYSNATNLGLNGYIDEFRIVKGSALWTSNFTPPTSAATPSYPTSQAYYVTTADASQINTATYQHITGAFIRQTTPTNTSLKYLVSFDDRSTWKYWNGSSWSSSSLDDLQTNGMTKATVEGLTLANWEASGGFVPGSGTLDFATDLATSDSASTPELDNISIGYQTFPASFTSSAFNSQSSSNTVSSVSWNGTFPTGTVVQVQARTAPDNSGAPGTWSGWKGPDGTSGSYFTVANGSESMPSAFTSGNDDQWMQYQVFLSTADIAFTPTITDMTLTYAVNAPPEFNSGYGTNGISVSQIDGNDGTNPGKVSISFSIKDIDTTTGTFTPNYVTPSFQYSLDGTTNWTSITTGNITWGSDPAGGGRSTYNGNTTVKVLEGGYLVYTLYWDAKTQIPETYSNTIKIKVNLTDNEAANYSATATGAAFALDVKNPTVGAHPILVDASVSPSAITLSSSDDTAGLKMKLGLSSDLSDASWVDYSASTTKALATDPDTVYVQFKDALGNTTSIYSATTPQTPVGTMIQDTSNLNVPQPYDYRLFIAWKEVENPTPGFGSYKVYRATSSNGPWTSLLYTITDRTMNYYGDSTITFDTNYYYKVKVTDSDGNVSYLSASVNGKANGQQDAGEGGGGSETTPPTISNVHSSSINTTQAVITWDTNELSNSTVGYSATIGNFDNETGVATMKDDSSNAGQHSVVLTGLSPNTTYYYQVKSADPSNNLASDNNGGNGYTFTTLSGPVISSVNISNIQNTSATINWTTNSASNSYVTYSSNSNLSSNTEIGTNDSVTTHSVNLSGLTSGTKYYFFVESGVSVDNNATGYYSLITTTDSTAPTITFNDNTQITDILTTSVVISWATSESSTSKVYYGLSDGSYTSNQSNSNFNIDQRIKLTGLTPGTKYYFKLESTDTNGNSATSRDGLTDYSFTTLSLDSTGPVISNIDKTFVDTTSAVITWTTDEDSTSKVEYGTTSGNLTSATVLNTNLNLDHSVAIINLTPDTKYYFHVISKDASNNSTTSSEGNFTTDKNPQYQHDALSAISNIADPPSIITDTKAVVTFNTDQAAKCTIEFGTQSGNYNEVPVVEANYNFNHSIHVTGLIFSTKYYYQISCVDNLGNAKESSEYYFTTAAQSTGDGDNTGDITAPDISGVSSGTITGESVTITWTTDEKSNSLVSYGITSGTYENSAGNYTVNSDKENYVTDHSVIINNLTPGTKYYFVAISSDISGNIVQSSENSFTTKSPSTLSSIKVVSTSLSEATITWTTDKALTSVVEYGITTDYGDSKSSNTSAKEHEISLSGLKAATIYHFRVKGKDADNNWYSSGDYSFEPKSPPKVSNANVSSVTEHEAKISITTDIPTDILVTYTDTKDSSKSGSQGKPDLTTKHEIELKNLESGRTYTYVVKVSDEQGNQTTSDSKSFTTGRDDTAPQISQIKTDNALAQNDKVQTIISWTTNEPATTSFIYKEGLNGEEKEISVSEAFTQNHIVVSTIFKTGTVYHFKVKSIDQSGNETVSSDFALLTPKKKENIVQIIVGNFQDIFGWARMVGR